MTFRRARMDDIAELPDPDDEIYTALFAASAIVRRGEWDDEDRATRRRSSGRISKLEIVERKWADMASRRKKKVRSPRMRRTKP